MIAPQSFPFQINDVSGQFTERARSSDHLVAQVVLEFSSPDHLIRLSGPQGSFLARLETDLDVIISMVGTQLGIAAKLPDQAHRAARIIQSLCRRIEEGHDIEMGDVVGIMRMEDSGALNSDVVTDKTVKRACVNRQDNQTTASGNTSKGDTPKVADQTALQIHTKKRTIMPRSLVQAHYVEMIRQHDLVFGLGPAGTGKTYLAVAMAVEAFLTGHVDRIILSRPAIEAGERLGFLPGDMREKIDPYLRPLYDALYDMLPADVVEKKLYANEIEIAPLAFMRGRTLSKALILVDEAQNTTRAQMKMLLTRMGEGSRMIVTGDLSQMDLPPGTPSGLSEAVHILQNVKGCTFVHFSDQDVVRHPLVARILRAYTQGTYERGTYEKNTQIKESSNIPESGATAQDTDS